MMESVYIHEAGHMVIGNALGLDEQGVEFAGVREGGAARAWYSQDDPKKTAMRSLAGLLAHVNLMPDAIPEPLLAAYRKSIVFDDAHPAGDTISDEDKEFLSGACDDIKIARRWAESVVGTDPTDMDVVDLLREIESEVRELVAQNASQILAVAKDMKTWHEHENHDDNAMMLYSPQRMNAILERWANNRMESNG